MWVSSVDDNKLGLSLVKDKCFGGRWSRWAAIKVGVWSKQMIFWSCSSKEREIQLDEFWWNLSFLFATKPLWNPKRFFYRSCSCLLLARRRNREPRNKLGFPTKPVTLGWLLVRGNETDRWQCLSGNIRCFLSDCRDGTTFEKNHPGATLNAVSEILWLT